MTSEQKAARRTWEASYREENRELLRKRHREYERKRRKVNISYRLASNLRIVTSKALTRGQKGGSAVRDLGCTIPELKAHLERQFRPGMSWENYGPKGWHIDHVQALAKFDLTDRKQFLQACHYTNLQPLWWQENLAKGGR